LVSLKVKALLLRCAGFDMVDLAAAKEVGLPVLRVPAYSPYAVAEHAAGLMMTLNRKYHRAYNRTREFNFNLQGLLGFDLHGKTVGVIGTGKIGVLFGKICLGFGCNVIAYDVYENDEAKALGMKYVSLDQLLETSDIISLHCPLFPTTKYMINEYTIRQMKKGAGVMLINTSRGGLLNTTAILQGLKSGQIGSLALDVFEGENDIFYEDHSGEILADEQFTKLMTFPNVLITGHQAYFTKEALDNIAKTTFDNVDAVATNGPFVNETGCCSYMKRGADQSRSAPVLPPPIRNGFPVESPLHAALNKMLHEDENRGPKRPTLPDKPCPFAPNDEPSASNIHPENPQLFAYTNALLHRVTGRYLPASVVGDGATQVAEIAHIQTDYELVQAVQSIQEISKQFHQVAQLVLAHRKELGKVLLKLETTYLSVFEKVLEASLRFYYKYRQEHAAERHHHRKSTLTLNTRVEELEETIRVLTHHVEAKEILLKSHRVQIRDLEYQQDEFRELKMYRLDYEKREAQLRKREEDLWVRRRHNHAFFLMEMLVRVVVARKNKTNWTRRIGMMKEQYQKQLDAVRKENEELLEYDRRDMPDMSSMNSATLAKTPTTAVATTQTEVDDDGLWDIQVLSLCTLR
ncbi:hypothetical protein DYB32_009056, partial [Aphanomyces invadans]